MSYEKEHLNRLMDIIHNPRDFTVSLPNKQYAVSSEDGERGLIIFDLRDEGQKRSYNALASYVKIQREINDR